MALTVYPVILFNSSTGSDTAASGAGPATAITGTAAAHTNGSATTTITFTNSPDLSGVATDGSHVLWLDTSSGRQFSRISTVNDGADTVVVEDSFNIASGSPVNYAIGGKRATFDNADSRTLFGASGAKPLWVIETETDQTIGSALTLPNGDTTSGWVHIRGDDPSTPRVITQTANASCFVTQSGGGRVKMCDLTLKNSNGTKTAAYGIELVGGTGTGVIAERCIFGDATNSIRYGIGRSSGNHGARAFRCKFINCESGIFSGSAATLNSGLFVTGCRITGCSSHGIDWTQQGPVTLIDTVVDDNGGDGVVYGQIGVLTAKGCIFEGNTGDGLDFSTGALSSKEFSSVVGCIFSLNGGVGIRAPTGFDGVAGPVDFNAFYSNTGGEVSGLSNGSNDETLSADPFVDAGAGDFNINNTAGGGAVLRAATVTLP